MFNAARTVLSLCTAFWALTQNELGASGFITSAAKDDERGNELLLELNEELPVRSQS